MTTVSLLLCLLSAPAPVDKFSLDLFEGHFVVRHRNAVQRVAVQAENPKLPLSGVYRRDHNFAVWDDRGLTIRIGSRAVSSRLPEISVSPRLQTREQIRKTLRLIAEGKRRRQASALSGSARVDQDAYFLVRWDDADGKPWLEALVKVDLAGPSRHWQFAGHFDGISTAQKPIDDALIRVDGKLGAIVRQDGAWGLATYSPKDRLFDFQKSGDDLIAWSPKGLFVEKTDYGTDVAGRLVPSTMVRSTLFETRGNARFLDDRRPLLAVEQQGKSSILRNVTTGALAPLPAAAAIRRAGDLVLVWAPQENPRIARLYRPDRWQELARWQAPAR